MKQNDSARFFIDRSKELIYVTTELANVLQITALIETRLSKEYLPWRKMRIHF